ncbi:uncharacterized protein [Procambarus clarkii]|uniref:uncharacterized protein n=1 Tax=Procambarus clarkii TaxID=6728 RepID=UPI003743DE68
MQLPLPGWCSGFFVFQDQCESLFTLHWRLSTGSWLDRWLKTMRGCLYVADSTGRLPTTLLPSDNRQSLEMSIYRKERHQLQELQEKTKNETVKAQVEEILKVQEVLFSSYWSDTTGKKNTMTAKSQEMSSGSQALLLASRSGFVQLIYLLVKVGGLAVDKPVDPTNDTTALHQAASCGKSCVIILLLNLGAQPLLPDRYGQTPPHLAAMFGHEHAFQLFAEFHRENIPYCKAGTSPQEVRRHYTKRLQIYNGCKFASELNVREINNDQREATENLLRHINFENLVEYTQEATVDYKDGESKDVKDAVVKEIQQIISKIETDIYKGNIKLVGSAADGTRLYYPDEFDFNFILEEIPGIKANIKQQTKEEVIVSGHKLKVELQTENTSLHGNNLISNFFERVRDCLKSYTFVNKQLSLVPPGLTRTQVGVAMTLAWQGSEYPLLIIGVDLVPVISVPWPEEIHRPSLTPSGLDTVHLSNTEDRGGSYICSFAATEVEVLANLDPQERQVYLTCKTLLSRMKAEPWMPKDMRNLFCWWDSRFWKIPTPEGFCLKNSFLKQVEKKRREGIKWQEDIISLVMSVFKEMCLEIVDEESGSSSFVPNKVNAYFGGDCARPKVGEGAPEIVNFLKKISLT